MQLFNCIIVEDEPIAAEILQHFIYQTPFLTLKGICIDAVYAREILQRETIDLMFLDIHLPRLNGLEFARTLKAPPKIIITSAYQEYAIEAFELNVLDYLLKPIEFNRFFTAVNRIRENDQKQVVINKEGVEDREHLFFNVNKKQVKIYLDEILYIESLREYVRITTSSKTILTKLQLSEMEELLQAQEFIRVHRSFIVAKNKIDSFSPSAIEIKGKQIPIGRNYKELVLSKFP